MSRGFWVAVGATLMAACHYQPVPVPVQAEPGALAALAGNWSGSYTGEQTGRSGIVGDGDPMDICVLTEKSIGHGDLLVQAIPIGGLRMIDANEADDKIIAVMRDDALYGSLTDISQCPPSVVERLRRILRPDDAVLLAVPTAEVTGD